jgi:hypothetical protein
MTGFINRKLILSVDFMKRTLALLVMGLFLSGCVNQPTAPHAAMDLVQPGADSVWNGGLYSLHVAERIGTALTGIQIRIKPATGEETVMTADSGTLAPGTPDNRMDPNSVRVTLNHVTSRTPTKWTVVERMTVVLHR